jgi:glycerate 2-kinase
MDADLLRTHVREIWDGAVAAVQPEQLVRQAVSAPGELSIALATARRIIVVGGGKAGAAMAAGFEAGLADRLDRISGVVNVPAGMGQPLQRIRLNVARPAGSNEPTAAGVAGTDEMLQLVTDAGPEDVVICPLSGGGSALLPAPAEGITLEDKQAVTRLLHKCGASIGEMNSVRKHLSRFKGGGLARTSRAGRLFSLILSDVVGDPLDVIASGPTAPDPTTFADALGIIQRFELPDRIPLAVRSRLDRGAEGKVHETLKVLPPSVSNIVIGNHIMALDAAKARAKALGYGVLLVAPSFEGPTSEIVILTASIIRGVLAKWPKSQGPVCLLSGGETTVTLTPDHGKGGRNTEFVLALFAALQPMPKDVVILSGGTDGEDGPTDAAGAIGDAATLQRAQKMELDVAGFLARHDSYTFFAATGDLLKTGLTGTNVMDVRVVLIGSWGLSGA